MPAPSRRSTDILPLFRTATPLTGCQSLIFLRGARDLVRQRDRRFKGPPIGDMIARRQAEIAAAEKAVGEAA